MTVPNYLRFTRSEYDAICGFRRLLDLGCHNEPTFRPNLVLLLSEDWPELATRVAREPSGRPAKLVGESPALPL